MKSIIEEIQYLSIVSSKVIILNAFSSLWNIVVAEGLNAQSTVEGSID